MVPIQCVKLVRCFINIALGTCQIQDLRLIRNLDADSLLLIHAI